MLDTKNVSHSPNCATRSGRVESIIKHLQGKGTGTVTVAGTGPGNQAHSSVEGRRCVRIQGSHAVRPYDVARTIGPRRPPGKVQEDQSCWPCIWRSAPRWELPGVCAEVGVDSAEEAVAVGGDVVACTAVGMVAVVE